MNAGGELSALAANYQAIDFGASVRANVDLGQNASLSPCALYRDPYNGDYRPRAGGPLIDAGFVVPGLNDGFVGQAPDIGAYEYNATEYWIPGRVLEATSMPVPFDGSTDVLADADFMFLTGKDAVAHALWLWTSASAAPIHTANLTAPSNIFTLPTGTLTGGMVCTWRVDAVGRDGVVVEGGLWSFDVMSNVTLSYVPSDDSYTHRYQTTTNFGE